MARARMILSAAGALLFLAAAGACKEASAASGFLMYSAGETWRVQETMSMKLPAGPEEEPRLETSRILLEMSVRKLYPDGSALIRRRLLESFSGEGAAEGPVEAESQPDAHLLFTPQGGIYLVGEKPSFQSPEEEEAAADFDFPDELGALLESDTASGFLETGRDSLDSYKVPAGKVAVGKEANREGFRVVRLPDESIGKAICEVYRARRGVVSETAWLDRRRGRILKRTIAQGDPESVSIVQVRMD